MATEELPVTSTSGQEDVEPIVGLKNCKLVSQGAEARVWETTFCGQPCIVKQRFSKKYRHPALDKKLTATRLKQEARSVLRARKAGVPTPVLYFVEVESASIYMERITGRSIRHLLGDGLLDAAGTARVMAEVGRLLALMHDGGLIHGDLTTSNMLVRESDGAVVMIDFGLSYNSKLPEDKGVDLYVMERALTSAHSQLEGLFDQILESYKKHSKQWSATFNRFAEGNTFP
ncbi:TP53 regulating kinase [Monoraphidium neglectum]|uniref:non-specific serine/threonine protein kinase n=1 Tax=Monoraphidium neglectum TaxID=145388 RepID=A0A0D2K957_9CHLO|nr:TP53 regulating kinase [Monoraphidium neglectum]KIZ06718.1 TP53 regulating kinase [Monoraphidium neglectum]|eukprot:XP_013905737.1 TP53 regulating kinase [Monoraphidium neglectum]